MTTSRDSLDDLLFALADRAWKDGMKGDNGDTQVAIMQTYQKIHQWALDREKEARVAELERLMKWSSGYPPDRSYTRNHFYVVERQDLADRIQELQKGNTDD